MNSDNCSLEIPYPPIEVQGRNIYYAHLLQVNYAGSNSELTEMTQYLYQHFLVNKVYEDLSEQLMCISQEEMKHFNILGNLIVLLGGDPNLRTVTGMRTEYWCGYNIFNEKCIPDFLERNIMLEEISISLYKNHISLIVDENIISILERIILDEENHIRIFKDLLTKYSLS